ncbi:IclR family transcriptional regulator [Verrucosispora sp. WMMD703]|uniref:Glycerol operon regulatory protein n=1 Tax=Micromonospora sediminimaris TaxID=547162 RepID=A0A9W5UT17_9ACTN|nr:MULTISPECIES: IclR family transcriptional regulator [Micromonospora]WFE47991.1 IclR family transcriptional regulator [Verrucosispora sp. WMMD1129]GIJ34516.1 IclR family transcriptional regulator [Micromonospora sediminimaris]SFD39634.1 transcriptional regulator, IclR family [Micromonospora sediminimaris]
MSYATDPSPDDGPAPRESGTQALDRALSVLLAFRGTDTERKVSDVSRELGLHKSTASRLFRALADAGFLHRNEENGNYRLGVTVFELGARYLAGLDLHGVARPLVHRLAEEEGESVNLSVLEGLDAISIHVVQGTRNLQLVSRLGRRIPLWCSAAGKALLIDQDDAQLRATLATAPFTALTGNTITDLDTFVSRMATVRQQGWALNDQESEEGLRVVAAPVRDRHGRVTGAISVSGPIFRLDEPRVAELAAAACRTADELSRQLGYGFGDVWGD